MEKFAGYGFNKSHSAAYALLAYHTACLKTHYPVEFMAALLTSEISKPENVVKYISECREMEIAVVPPDVQISDADFTPDGEAIRFGLTAIKNVGHNAIESILAARAKLAAEGSRLPILWEFCEQVDLRLLNKRVMESLIKAGALDCFGPRARLMAGVDKAMERAQKSQRDCGGRAAWALRASSTCAENRASAVHAKSRCPTCRTGMSTLRLQIGERGAGLLCLRAPDGQVRGEARNLKAVDTADAWR